MPRSGYNSNSPQVLTVLCILYPSCRRFTALTSSSKKHSLSLYLRVLHTSSLLDLTSQLTRRTSNSQYTPLSYHISSHAPLIPHLLSHPSHTTSPLTPLSYHISSHTTLIPHLLSHPSHTTSPLTPLSYHISSHTTPLVPRLLSHPSCSTPPLTPLSYHPSCATPPLTPFFSCLRPLILPEATSALQTVPGYDVSTLYNPIHSIKMLLLLP